MKSLSEIAKELGVSTATVSYVYNGKWKEKRIGAELAEKVRRKLDEENCHPNPLGMSLKTGKTMTVGVILSDLSNPYNLAILKGIDKTLTTAGYDILLSTSRLGSHEDRVFESLASKGFDGILMSPYKHHDWRKLAAVNSKRAVSIVFLDTYDPSSDIDFVVSDNRGGTFAATNSCLAAGRRRIAYLGSRHNSAGPERFEGYAAALAAAGIRLDDALIERGLKGAEGLVEGLERIFARSEPPDALFTESFLYFADGFKFLADKGVRVPEQLMLIGFDDYVGALRAHPELRARNLEIPFIEQDAERMGELASKRLVELMTGAPDSEPLRLFLAPIPR